jgi:hypothetical protein
MALCGWRYLNHATSQCITCPSALGPLEDFARHFDDLFRSLAQRRGFRDYLPGLLWPCDRNKTLPALVSAEPAVGVPASGGPVPPVSFSRAPPGSRRPSIPEFDRQDRQRYRQRYRRGEQPVDRQARLRPVPRRTKPHIAVALVDAAFEVGVSFRVVVADCLYGDNPTYEDALVLVSGAKCIAQDMMFFIVNGVGRDACPSPFDPTGRPALERS